MFTVGLGLAENVPLQKNSPPIVLMSFTGQYSLLLFPPLSASRFTTQRRDIVQTTQPYTVTGV